MQKHIEILGDRENSEADDSAVTMSDGRRGRVDLMLSKAIQPRIGEYDFLIVELKRPSQKINDSIVTKIKKYARAVAGDERVRGNKTRWTFIAVSNEFDDFARKEANQERWPYGQIAKDAGSNTTIWIKEWSQIISDARARLQFIRKQLSYEADSESARDYLKRAHAKFIPKEDEAPTAPSS